MAIGYIGVDFLQGSCRFGIISVTDNANKDHIQTFPPWSDMISEKDRFN